MVSCWGWIIVLGEALQLVAPVALPANSKPTSPAVVAAVPNKPAASSASGATAKVELAANSGPGTPVTPIVAAPPSMAVGSAGSSTTVNENNASDAERIARLQRSVDTDESRLLELRRVLNDPESEYSRAEKSFKELDAALEATKRKLQESQSAGRLDEVDELEDAVEMQAEPWRLAKNAFELALEERRTKQASLATLEAKIQRDRVATDKLLAPTPPATPTAIAPSETNAMAPLVSATPLPGPTVTAAPSAVTPAPIVPPPALTAETPAAQTQPSTTTSPMFAAMAPSLPEGSGPANISGTTVPKEPSKEVKAATVRAEVLVAEAQEAENEAVGISERLDLLRDDIAQQRQLRQLAMKKVDTAESTTARLSKELEQSPERGEDWDQIWTKLTQAQQEEAVARVEARQLADRLDELQSELSMLQQDELAAMRAAEDKRKDAEAAKTILDELQNPFSLKNLSTWLQTNGLIIGVIILVLFLILRMGSYVEPRLTQLFISTSPRGSREERENRATTLVSVLLNVVRTAAVVIGGMLIMEQFGVPVGPLLGGAAVVGLAVAFGAQSLIKDYFTGFMVLLEQQYMINDVIQIGDIKGQVERITMRMTVLRDMEGRVHFVPHGQINTVTNMTHGWSRTVIDLGVSYNEDVDRVIEVLTSIGMELHKDSKFGPMILDTPEIVGVESLGDSAVVVRMLAKTRPLRQWDVKREWLKRIKRRFDELGIEIPYPHQTIYLRTAGNEAIACLAHEQQPHS